MKFTFFNKYQPTTQRPVSRGLTTGFTLIETLIYIALYSLVIGGAIVAVYTIFESAGRNQTKAMMAEEGMFLVSKIDWTLSGVKTINNPSLNATSSQLSVTKYDNSVIVLTLSTEGTMMLKEGAAAALPLNNTNTEVSKLTFVNTGTSSPGIIPEGVRATFTLSARAPNGMVVTEDFSTTQYLRK